MIPNLNFYDIYGYLIPGLAALVLFWLPSGLIEEQVPTADWTSALAVVAIGYIIGHLVQALARNALPSRTLKGRFPSEVLLDSDDEILSADLKERLAERIKRLSAIDVRADLAANQVDAQVSASRRDGFYFCRDALLTSKTPTYAEQMQGMYSLMAGLTMGFALAVPYHLGWALSRLVPAAAAIELLAWLSLAAGLISAGILAAIGALKHSSPLRTDTNSVRYTVGFIMLGLLGLAYSLGASRVAHPKQGWPLLAMVPAGLLASFICYRVYKYFTVVYAQTVYRTFNLYEKPPRADESGWRPFAAQSPKQ